MRSRYNELMLYYSKEYLVKLILKYEKILHVDVKQNKKDIDVL